MSVMRHPRDGAVAESGDEVFGANGRWCLSFFDVPAAAALGAYPDEAFPGEIGLRDVAQKVVIGDFSCVERFERAADHFLGARRVAGVDGPTETWPISPA